MNNFSEWAARVNNLTYKPMTSVGRTFEATAGWYLVIDQLIKTFSKIRKSDVGFEGCFILHYAVRCAGSALNKFILSRTPPQSIRTIYIFLFILIS